MNFTREPCFCKPLIQAKILVIDVSGPYPASPDGNIYSLNAICKATGKRCRSGGKLK